MAITEILPGIHYVGVNDRTTTRFEWACRTTPIWSQAKRSP